MKKLSRLPVSPSLRLSVFPLLLLALVLVLRLAACDTLTEPTPIIPDELRPAIVTALAQQVEEDGALVIDIEANDPNGEAMTLSLTTPPEHGTAAIEAASKRRASTPAAKTARLHAELRVTKGEAARKTDAAIVGRIRYVPADNFHGTDRIGLAVRNASGFTAEAELRITIEAVPDAPRVVATIPAQTAAVGGIPFSIDLATIFTDPDGEALTFEASSSNEMMATASTNGSILVVTVQRVGTATITATATDPAGLSASTSFSITGGGNRCPTRIGEIPAQVLDVGGPPFVVEDLTTLFEDADGDALLFSALSTNPDAVEARIEGSRLTVTKRDIGLAAITVVARDGLCAADEPISFTVTDPNAPEVIRPFEDVLLEAGQTLTFSDLATRFRDPEGAALSFSAEADDPAIAEASVAGTTLSVTGRAEGQTRVVVTAARADGRSAQDAFVVTVEPANQPPQVLNGIPDQQLTVGGSSFVIDLATIFTDPDGDALVFSAQSSNAGFATAQVSGTQLTVAPVAPGGATITATATDPGGTGTAVTTAFTATVEESAGNVAPTANDDVASTPEDTPITIAVLGNDRDPDGLLVPASVTVVLVPEHGSVDARPDGTIHYAPSANYHGPDRFGYTVEDDDGAVSNPATVALTVNPINDSPIARDDSYSLQEGNTLTIEAPGILSNDTDIDGDALTAVLTQDVSQGTLALAEDGSFSYTPDAGFFGTDTFRYEADDGPARSAEVTVRLQVSQGANEPPIVTNPGAQNNAENDPVSLQITATDPDAPLTYASSTLPPGLALDAGTGLISGTLAADAAGATGTMVYAVEVFVTDTRAGQASALFDWTVTNPAPTISPLDQTNDDGETITPLTISATDDDAALTFSDGGTLPPGLALDPSTGVISGTLATDASAASPYSVAITVSDGQGGQDTANFFWIVNNPAPSATAPGNQANDENEPISLTISATDDDAISFAATGLPTGLAIDPDTGEISGTIANGAADSSPYSVVVTVTDAQGAATPVSFAWTVTNPSPAVTNPGAQMNDEGDLVSLQIVATDDDALTYAAPSLPGGLSIDPNTGEISGTVADDAADNSPYSVEVTVTDAQGAATPVSFQWTVNNPPPSVTDPGDQSDLVLDLISLSITASDPDTPLTYSATGLPGGLSIDSGTGEISGTVADDAASATPYAVVVTVTDSRGAGADVSFDWTISNPAPTLASVSPTSGAITQSLTLTLTGTNFVDGVSSVSIDPTGQPVHGVTITDTRVLDDTTIEVDITIDALATPGDRAVTVTNATPGGGTSGAQTFEVTL